MPRSAKSSELIMSPSNDESSSVLPTGPSRPRRSAVAGCSEKLGGVEVERLDSVADRRPVVPQEPALLAFEQQLAHAFLDDESDAAPGLGVFLELAIRARGGERVHDEVARE